MSAEKDKHAASHSHAPPPKPGLQAPKSEEAFGLKSATPGVVGDALAGREKAPAVSAFTKSFAGRIGIPADVVHYWMHDKLSGELTPRPAFLYERGFINRDVWAVTAFLTPTIATELRDVPFSEEPREGCWTWPVRPTEGEKKAK